MLEWIRVREEERVGVSWGCEWLAEHEDCEQERIEAPDGEIEGG